MCREADLRDGDVKRLCGQISESQRREIDEMKAILDRIDWQSTKFEGSAPCVRIGRGA